MIKNIIYAKGTRFEYLVVYQDSGYIETNKYKGKLSGSILVGTQMVKKKRKGLIKMVRRTEIGMAGILMVKKNIVQNLLMAEQRAFIQN